MHCNNFLTVSIVVIIDLFQKNRINLLELLENKQKLLIIRPYKLIASQETSPVDDKVIFLWVKDEILVIEMFFISLGFVPDDKSHEAK